MEGQLLKIVEHFSWCIENCIDLAQLNKLTVCHPLDFAKILTWTKVRELAIVGTSTLWENTGKVKQGCYVGKNGKLVLLLGLDTTQIAHWLSRCSSGLKTLFIGHTDLIRLQLPFRVGLQELSLVGNEELSDVIGLDGLTGLKMLTIYRSKCDFELDLTPFSQLESLRLIYSGVTSVSVGCTMNKLLDCSVSHTEIPDTEFLDQCPVLEYLDLSGHRIQRIPESIRRLKNLRKLYLWDLELEELPDWLPELGLTMGNEVGFGISLRDTTVKGVNMSIFDQSQEVILAWFEAQRKAKAGTAEEAKPLNEIKVVFLGDGSAGKSLTVARLMQGGIVPANFDGEATPGIAIEDREYDLPDGRKVQVHFWDFGGQEILHSMHRIFLTDRTLYVVMINARNNRNKTQDDQARYWLHNVRSFAPDCPVLLVLNQIDQNPNASINERSLRKLYPNLRQVVRLSALTYDQDTFNKAFTEQMLAQIGDFKSLATIFPPEWKRIMDRLRGMEGSYIRGREYSKLCWENGVEGQTLQRDLLKWCNDIGVSFCCNKSAHLRDYVVLKPEWITNAIYTIIWNKRSDTANGMVDQEEIYNLLSPGEGSGVKRVRSDMKYALEDVDYVLRITRQFRLSFQMDTGHEFIPMLCDADELPEADDFLDDSQTIEFRMEYDYLPDNVLHRLMVDMRHDLISDKVWFTGALFRQKYNGVTALVKSEGNVLSIYIRTTDPDHRAHSYLNTLRSALDAIHEDMNLKPPEMLVAYREDDDVDYFSYEMLEGTRRNNVETVYSRVFRRMIPIADILNRSDSQVVQKKEKLLRDVAKAIIGLQENRLMDDTAEDNRNDELCRALRYMGYNMADQTHVGRGGTGKRAGSLDLRIYHEDNLPWTNLEAMNLKSASDSQLAYWDDHLKRLMDNYDPAGLPLLFLISYVNCAEDQYHKLCSAYTEHMRFHSPDKAELRHGTLSSVQVTPDQTAYLQVAKCTYDLSGTPVTVYHYFAGFIDQ